MNLVKRTGIVVQMRLDSKRLPGKALLRIGGTNLAGMVLRRLRACAADEYVLATDADGAKALAETAREFGFSIFAGPKDDVLARYAMAARAFGLTCVIRATGDNPFVSVVLATRAIEVADATGADYVGLVGMPVGMGVEVVHVPALYKAEIEATGTFNREHVCPYLYANPDVFAIQRPECPAEYRLPDARVTVDTPADFRQAEAIVADIGNEPSDLALLAWLKGLQKGA